MTEFVGAEKPSLEELVHSGVKGMKWGQRKKYSTADIKDARARQGSRLNEVNQQAHKLNLATGKAKDKAAKDYVKKLNALQDHPDAAIGGRMTKGEKAAALLLTGPIGAIVIAGNASAVRKHEREHPPKN